MSWEMLSPDSRVAARARSVHGEDDADPDPRPLMFANPLLRSACRVQKRSVGCVDVPEVEVEDRAVQLAEEQIVPTAAAGAVDRQGRAYPP